MLIEELGEQQSIFTELLTRRTILQHRLRDVWSQGRSLRGLGIEGKAGKAGTGGECQCQEGLETEPEVLVSQKRPLILQGSHERGLVLDKDSLGRQIEDLVFLTMQSLQGTLHCNLKSYGYRKEHWNWVNRFVPTT